MFKDYLLDRFKEASTWRGLVMLAMAAGLHIDPALADQIITAGVAVVGALGALIPDRK